ncbi:MAG: UvrD-helicase domain-containing protein [Fimbriimonas sp.]|nr:UvrD-helicase domain-containing protein [Fimbriimonas sp.]
MRLRRTLSPVAGLRRGRLAIRLRGGGSLSSDSKTQIPTAEQRQVIEAPEPNFTVIASAGAGKTFVLVERYLRHVEEELLQPDQILTITFTKKAAAEMKKRIVQRLRQKGLMEQAQIAETGPIQTIHSFCERLLRENSLEAGLDPQFEIMAEDRSARLVTNCVREVLASPFDDEPEAEALIRFLAGKRQGFGDNKSPYGILESAVETVLRELRGSKFDYTAVVDRFSNPTVLRQTWEQVMRDCLPERARSVFDELDVPDLRQRAQQACKEASVSVPGWARGKGDADGEYEGALHACGLVHLACEAWWRLDREMDRLQELDFSSLEIRANRLLLNSQVTRERIRGQYLVIMVDESQDVNPIQYSLLDNLGCERVMMVGDAQQSIYAFRQADVELFRSRAVSGTTKRLLKNWRSVPGILNFVDAVFSGLWGQEYAPMQTNTGPMDFDLDDDRSYEGVEIWRQPAKSPTSTAGYIRELIDEGVEKGDIAILVRDGAGALAMKKVLDEAEIANRITGGSERFYTRLEVRDLANVLRATADPYDDFALLATLRSPMVGLSLDSIALLGMESFVIERLGDFEPPVEGDGLKLRSFLEWYLPLNQIADRLSAWEVLAEIYACSDYLPALARRAKGDQMLANARKLLTLATEEPELGPLEYSDRIREIQDLRHKEGDAPADDNDADLVKILTIHKAKGLEWPVVVLPQTDKALTSRARDVVVEPNLGMVATKFGKGQGIMHKLLTDMKKARNEAEERRVLYVALTRAQRRLCICIVPPSNATTASKLIDGFVDPAQMPGIRVRSTYAPQPRPV